MTTLIQIVKFFVALHTSEIETGLEALFAETTSENNAVLTAAIETYMNDLKYEVGFNAATSLPNYKSL